MLTSTQDFDPGWSGIERTRTKVGQGHQGLSWSWDVPRWKVMREKKNPFLSQGHKQLLGND